MRIVRWSIDGFGVFTDHHGDELSGGLTVIHGANEAGKSTLLAFLRGVLFGFPDGRSTRPRYQPVFGGKHGGRLVLEHDGQVFTVARAAGKKTKATVTLPDGSLGTDADLAILLGNADAALFESVFAFSLTELQELDTLTSDAVANRIFSAGLVGAGQTAQSVLSTLDARAGALYKPRARDSEIGALLKTCDEATRQLAVARTLATGYQELNVALDAATDTVKKLQQWSSSLRNEEREFKDLIALWPVAQESQVTYAEIKRVVPLDQTTVAALEVLERTLELQRTRLAALSDARAGVATRESALGESLGELGSDWTAERLQALDTGLTARDELRGWGERLTQSESEVRSARAAQAQSQAELTRVHETTVNLAARRPATEPPTLSDLEGREAGLRRVRASVAELRSAGARAPARPWRSRGAALAGLLVMITFVVWRGLAGDVWATVAGLLTMAALAAFGWRGNSGPRRNAFEQSEATAAAADLALLGLDETASFARLEELDGELRRRSDARREWDRLGQAIEESGQREAAAATSLAQCQATLKAAELAAAAIEHAWTAWKDAAGVPAGLSPAGVTDFFSAARQAVDRLAALADTREELAKLEQGSCEWEDQARKALADSAAERGEGLLARLEVLIERGVRLRTLGEQARRHEQALTVAFGAGAHADSLRDRLAGGAIDEWREGARSTAEMLDRAETELTDAIEQRRDIEMRRRALAESADVAALELEREGAITALGNALESWRIARLAYALMSRTLDAFVSHNQPRLLEHATRLFSQVTGGRFVQIVQRDTRQEFAVIDTRGERLATADLSRGTAEQLYLCVRLAFAAEFSQHGTTLPLVMDDVLVNFDPKRAAAMVRVIGEVAEDRQVLVFTCHPETRDLFAAQLGARAALVELGPQRHQAQR